MNIGRNWCTSFFNYFLSIYLFEQAWKSFSELWSRWKTWWTKEIFLYNKHFDTAISEAQKPETGQKTRFGTTEKFCRHKKYFLDTTIRSKKTWNRKLVTGNRKGNRTPDQPENFRDDPECQYEFACINLEIGNWTENRI